MDSGCPTDFATMAGMNRKQQFVEAVQMLAPGDSFMLETARRIKEDKFPARPGGAALEFVGAMQTLRLPAMCKLRGSARHKRSSSRRRTAANPDRLPLTQALRAKSAEYWLKLGEEAQALAELEKLPERARTHRSVVKVHLSIMRAIRERNENNSDA